MAPNRVTVSGNMHTRPRKRLRMRQRVAIYGVVGERIEVVKVLLCGRRAGMACYLLDLNLVATERRRLFRPERETALQITVAHARTGTGILAGSRPQREESRTENVRRNPPARRYLSTQWMPSTQMKLIVAQRSS